MSKAIELTKDNARRLDQLAKLVGTPAGEMLNFMLKETLDTYLDKDMGYLIETIDGWKYKTEAEARKVVALVNEREKKNGYNRPPMSVKGCRIINAAYRAEKVWNRKVA